MWSCGGKKKEEMTSVGVGHNGVRTKKKKNG